MSSSLDLLIFLIFSMHACTARPLNMVTDLPPPQSHTNSQQSLLGLEVKQPTSGKEIIVPPSSHDLDLAKASKTNQEVKRMMLLGKASDDSEEIVDESEEREGAEDVDVMDYAQPHKKPPIHNEKKH